MARSDTATWIEPENENDPVARYGHIAGLLRRYAGIDDAECLRAGCGAYAEVRENKRYDVIGPDEARAFQAVIVFPPASATMLAPDLTVPAVETYPLMVLTPEGQIDSFDLSVHADSGLADHDDLVDALNNAVSATSDMDAGQRPDPRETAVLQQKDQGNPLGLYTKEGNNVVDLHVRDAEGAVIEAVEAVVDRRDDLDLAGMAARNGTRKLDEQPFKAAFRAVQGKFERRRLHRALRWFSQHLDPEALRLVRATGRPTADAYNALVVDEPARVYRRQALRAYPLFAQELLKPNVLAAIDDGEAPPAVMAKRLYPKVRLPDTVENADAEKRRRIDRLVRRLHGVTWQRAGREAYRDPSRLIEKLASLPADWQPRTRPEYAAMRAVLDAVGSVSSATSIDRAKLIQSTRGQWRALAAKLGQEPATGLRDMADHAYKQIVLATWTRMRTEVPDADFLPRGMENPFDRRSLQKLLNEAVFGQKGLGKLLDANSRYHRSLNRLAAAAGENNEEVTWLGAIDAPWTVKGYEFVELTAQSALTEEGKVMGHCVGGYADNCLNGYHVFSVRSNGRRVATLGVRETDDPEVPFAFNQCYAQQNSKAPDGAERAAWAFVARLNEPDNQPDFDALVTHRQKVKEDMPNQRMRIQFGFDPANVDAQRNVFAEWRRLMIGPGRKYPDLETFLQETGIAQELEKAFETYKAQAAAARREHIAKSVSNTIEDELQTKYPDGVTPDIEALRAGVLSEPEYRYMLQNRQQWTELLDSATFVLAHPGKAPLIRDAPVDWRHMTEDPNEAKRRARILYEHVAQKVVQDPCNRSLVHGPFRFVGGVWAVNNEAAVVVADTRAEARAYVQAAHEVYRAFEGPDERSEYRRAMDAGEVTDFLDLPDRKPDTAEDNIPVFEETEQAGMHP